MNEYWYLKKIRNGNQNALNEFIEELYPYVYRYVYRKMNGEDSTKDITQETFIRFIRVLPTYQARGKVLHFLYMIASNLCNDYFKKKKRENHLELIEEIIEDTKMKVHEGILKQINDEYLMEVLQQLKPLLQDVIILKYYEQLTFREIARMYQIPESTVKSRHTQALRKLKQLMKEGEENV